MDNSYATRIKTYPGLTKTQSKNLSHQELQLLLFRPPWDPADSTGKLPFAIDFSEKPQWFPAAPYPGILRRVIPGILNSGYRHRIISININANHLIRLLKV